MEAWLQVSEMQSWTVVWRGEMASSKSPGHCHRAPGRVTTATLIHCLFIARPHAGPFIQFLSLFPTGIWTKWVLQPHFTDQATKTQRGTTCPESHTSQVPEQARDKVAFLNHPLNYSWLPHSKHSINTSGKGKGLWDTGFNVSEAWAIRARISLFLKESY